MTNNLANDPPVGFARGVAEEELWLSKGLAQRIDPNDVVTGISVSGSTGFVYDALERAKAKGAFTIGITERPDSYLGDASDLIIQTQGKPEGPCASKTMMASLFVVFSICLPLAKKAGVTANQCMGWMEVEGRTGKTKAGGVK